MSTVPTQDESWTEYRATFATDGKMQVWQLDEVHSRPNKPFRIAIRLTMTVIDEGETYRIKVAKDYINHPWIRSGRLIDQLWKAVLNNREWVLKEHRRLA